MNEKDIKDAIKQRIANKIQNACDGENIADAIMGNEQNQDFIDTNEQDKAQDTQNEAQIEKDVKDEKEDKETTNREIGKFKNPEELLRAYGLLEKEFTKKSQRLKELENTIATPFKTEEDWKVAVDKFFERTPSAKPFAKDIAKILIDNPDLRQDKNCLDIALVSVLSEKFKTPEQLLSDGQFLNDYVLCSDTVKQAVIQKYLGEMREGMPPTILSRGGLQCVAPDTKPKTIEEAGALFLKNNK